MNDVINIESPGAPDDAFEQLVRQRLHDLAQVAPATVRQVDEIVVGPVRVARRGGRRRGVGIGATIAALAAALGVTAVALNGAGSGGAGTPKEAVLLFVDALEHQDILGMIDVIDPTEVPAFRAAAEQGTAEAQRVDLLDSGFSLDGVEGVDVGVTDLTLATEQLTADVAVVSATSGSIATTFDPATFPFGETLRQIIGTSSPTSTTTDLGPDGADLHVATVQRDGRWFVSVSYTVAEYARRAADVDLPIGPGVVAEGFDSPEAAGTAFFERLAAYDFEALVATAAPGEGNAMRWYAPLWLPAAAELTDRGHEAGFDLHLSSIGFDINGSEDRRTLTADTFVIDGTYPPDLSSARPPFDATLPTYIRLDSGLGWVVVPAGEPLPLTIEGLSVVGDQPPNEDANFTTAGRDGVIRQLPVRNAVDPDAPLALHIERADGCTTWSGAGSVSFISPSYRTGPLDGFEQLAPDVFRSCASAPLGVVGVLSFLGAGVTELPELATIQVDGQWYVSPLGTVAASIIDVLRDVPESGSLFDSPLALSIYGTSRDLLEMQYVGRPSVELPPECAALFEFDASGTPTGVVADPPPSLIRTCTSEDFVDFGSGASPPPVSVVEPAAPAPTMALPTATTVAGG